MPAYNGRFGKIAALAPHKRQCEFGSYYPAGSSVEAATSPICRTLAASGWTAMRTLTQT